MSRNNFYTYERSILETFYWTGNVLCNGLGHRCLVEKFKNYFWKQSMNWCALLCPFCAFVEWLSSEKLTFTAAFGKGSPVDHKRHTQEWTWAEEAGSTSKTKTRDTAGSQVEEQTHVLLVLVMHPCFVSFFLLVGAPLIKGFWKTRIHTFGHRALFLALFNGVLVFGHCWPGLWLCVCLPCLLGSFFQSLALS